MSQSWSDTTDGHCQAESLPEMETVQQFRLISASMPLKIEGDALALDAKDELLPSLVYAEDLLSGPADGMGRQRSVLEGDSAEPMRIKMLEREDPMDDIDFSMAVAPGAGLRAIGDCSSEEIGIPQEWLHATTIMMRNLPNKYTQRMLLMEVNHAGFLGTFDFLYLPIDTETGANRGYAFLNFLDPALAWTFRTMYEGRRMSRFNSSKIITVVPATLQGFEANYMHYAFARVSRGDPAARPLFLREMKSSPGRDAHRPVASKMAGLDDAWYNHLFPYEEPANLALANAMAWSESDGTSQPDAEASGLEPATSYVPKFCSQCGGRISLMFVFCPSCGQALDFSCLA